MTFEVHPFRAAERDVLASMILGIQTGEFGVDVTLEGQPDLLDPAAFFRKGAGEFWVACDPDGTPIGSIGLLECAPGLGAIRKMFVRADRRGREFGVAQTLLETLIAHAKREGISTLLLGTVEILKAARRFYERNGFREIPADDLPPAFPRMKVDTHFYRMDL
ncbi:MAG: GNAT family N-acetyltransferase [Azospirillum sp.]|nr:GNAT family N-acetyltransferase [Azospirillum sp.]